MLSILFFVAMTFLVYAGVRYVWQPIAERRRASVAPDGVSEFDQRLERIESAIDVMAVEVERMGELQRHLTNVYEQRRAIAATAGERPADSQDVSPEPTSDR